MKILHGGVGYSVQSQISRDSRCQDPNIVNSSLSIAGIIVGSLSEFQHWIWVVNRMLSLCPNLFYQLLFLL